MIYFSYSTSGFYDDKIHGKKGIPEEAVQISDSERWALLEGQSKGKIIVCGPAGKPVLADPPSPSAEVLSEQARNKASAYLASTDWYVSRKIETGKEIPEEVTTKRQEARDLLSK